MLLYYLLIINAAGFILMLVDKLKARKNLWRIPEAVLIWTAVAGGSIGVLAGMYTVRHKTLHVKFTLGVPVILTLQIVGAVFLYSFLQKRGCL